MSGVILIGASMHPTLRAADILDVVPYDKQKMRCGDVVVFLPPGAQHQIAHRIHSLGKDGIQTRGDNHQELDSFTLRPEHIIGRVTAVQRGNRKLYIHCGLAGRIYIATLRAVRRTDHALSSLLHTAYHRLAETGIFRHLVPAGLKPRVVVYRRPTGMERHLFMGGKLIGKRLPGDAGWRIYRPFRLFVDEESLPQGLLGQDRLMAERNED